MDGCSGTCTCVHGAGWLRTRRSAIPKPPPKPRTSKECGRNGAQPSAKGNTLAGRPANLPLALFFIGSSPSTHPCTPAPGAEHYPRRA